MLLKNPVLLKLLLTLHSQLCPSPFFYVPTTFGLTSCFETQSEVVMMFGLVKKGVFFLGWAALHVSVIQSSCWIAQIRAV